MLPATSDCLADVFSSVMVSGSWPMTTKRAPLSWTGTDVGRTSAEIGMVLCVKIARLDR